jgi:hypothetical protein
VKQTNILQTEDNDQSRTGTRGLEGIHCHQAIQTVYGGEGGVETKS